LKYFSPTGFACWVFCWLKIALKEENSQIAQYCQPVAANNNEKQFLKAFLFLLSERRSGPGNSGALYI
jgi:hypothetical protein